MHPSVVVLRVTLTKIPYGSFRIQKSFPDPVSVS